MSFLEAADAPIIQTIDGKEITFPLLEIEDLSKIGRSIQSAKRSKAIAALPMTATPAEREYAGRFYEDQELLIDDLARSVFTLDGMGRVLIASLVKSGKTPQDAQVIVKQFARENGWQKASLLAADVSAIFPPAAKKKAAANPTQPAQEPANPSNEIGQETSSLSDVSQDAIRAA